jgi:hypothetical protein
MPRPICRTSWLSSISRLCAAHIAGGALAAALSLSSSPVLATGPGNLDEYHSFFAPEIIGRPDEHPFFLSMYPFYSDLSESGDARPTAIEEANLKEWSAYLGGKVSDENLRFLLYKMKLPELDRLIWALEGKRGTLSKEAAALRGQLDTLGNPSRVMQSLYYLGVAKRCEPIATRGLADDAWDADKMANLRSQDAVVAEKLLAGSAAQLSSISDPFLQERYRFQRLRLMFYTSRHGEAEKYYNANIDSFKSNSGIKYRFMDIAAGSLRRNGKQGQSNYMYSYVFGHYGPLKRSAYLSFRPKEDTDWKSALALAKSDYDKQVLWQLLGISADGLGAIEKIFAISPGSELLPLLLVREVNKAERDLGEYRTERSYSTQPSRSAADIVGKKRLAILKRISDAQTAYKPYLWSTAIAHMYALIGDNKAATTYLDLAEKGVGTDTAVAAQIRMTRLLTRVQGLKAVDKGMEPYLADELNWLASSKNSRADDLSPYVLDLLSKRYRAAGDPLRGQLLYDRPDADLYRSNDRIDALAEFVAKPGKSPFDEFLVKNYSRKYNQQQLLEIKAINDLYAGNFKSAADLLAKSRPEAGNLQLEADPFSGRLNDCHDCDIADKKATKYTRTSFVRRLITLAGQADRPGAEGAQASLLVGNALYNMSYYGNGRLIYQTEHYNFPNRSPLTVQMQLAEKYYKRAMELSPDREVQAKACFMAAKTEQNRYFAAQEKKGKPPADPQTSTHSPIYFKRLQEQYANTKYYQEVVRECSYFRFYVKR